MASNLAQPPGAVGRSREPAGRRVLYAVLLVAAGGAIVANEGFRGWMTQRWSAVLTGAAVAVLVGVAVSIVAQWPKMRQVPAKGAAIVAVGLSLIGLFLASVIVMPSRWQLVTLRSVVLVVLIVFPTLMWWLFLSSKRESLLNEFLSDLRRLGLLDLRPDGHETEAMRNTRVSSYLQKFEASYGTLRPQVHHDVHSGHIRPYTSNDERASDQQPLATAAVPIYFNSVVLAVGWLVTLPPIETFPATPPTPSEPRWLLAFAPNVTAVTAAFMGAYFFSIQMLFRRYVRGDLRGSAYIAVTVRVVLAVVGIWTLQAVATALSWKQGYELILAGFAVGVFPFVAWQIIRAAACRMFRTQLPTLDSRLPLDNLDGITVWHQARLEEEDVENVPNMATVDVVDLLVNTRFPAGRIVDWVDQALLLTALGPADGTFLEPAPSHAGQAGNFRQELAQYGIRTASALVEAAGQHARRTPWTSTDLHKDRRARALARSVSTSGNLPLILSWRRGRPVAPGGAAARVSAGPALDAG